MFAAMMLEATPHWGLAWSPAWLYLPVGLHPGASFRGRDSMASLYRLTLPHAEASLVLLADDLLAYHTILKGEAGSVEAAFAKARRLGARSQRLAERIRQRHPQIRNNIVCTWSELAGHRGFREVHRRLRQCLRAETDVAQVFREAAHGHAARFGWRPDAETNCWAERYLIEEAAMSLYVAEGLGYWKEIREVSPDRAAAEPLSFLYEARNDQIRWLAGRPRVRRRLEFLDLDEARDERLRA